MTETLAPGRDLAADVGAIHAVSGPVVTARGLTAARLYNVVLVGHARLPGEVIRLDAGDAIIQVYEDTAGLAVGEPVADTGEPLQVELGPGLLGSIFDGTQRPLTTLARRADDPVGVPMIERGASAPSLDRTRVWQFETEVAEGDEVSGGDVLGTVQETGMLVHRVLVPPGVAGAVTRVARDRIRIDEPVAWIDGEPLMLLSRWPVRLPRPFAGRLALDEPLVTGQRAIDSLFPIARGGTATIPGGFGTGKTVLEQSLAKWSHADVIVYVACGERGNELTEMLDEFPKLTDPRTGSPLLERTVIIANTSNMPVAAREASIYTGITIAEYFRDQGREVAVLADSTSRWGEALREVSSRLEEMPAEEGYPAYLSTRLAEFYERAGAVACLGSAERTGSVSIVGAVSPAGGDFSEPITQHSLRLVGTFWGLDTNLARRRHFPAIDWNRSYTLYDLDAWFDDAVAPDWHEQRAWALDLLQQESALLEIVQLLGSDSLAPAERVVLETGRLLREDFLQQSAFDEVDAYCALPKQHRMLRVLHAAHESMVEAVARDVPVDTLAALPALRGPAQMRRWTDADVDENADALIARIRDEVGEL
ncbi:MAG TPA: V-type ATP synthase subunit A [Gaiellaceae bacterium]|nr:V-type ATP synthase subunit A [Gaiellaceae bacterium]